MHNIWQVSAWDTCPRINLQGLLVYEKHCLFRHKFMLQRQNACVSLKRRIINSAEMRPIYFCSLWPCRPALFILQSCTLSSTICIFHTRPWNIKTLTQHVLSHADITSMSGQEGSSSHVRVYLQEFGFITTINPNKLLLKHRDSPIIHYRSNISGGMKTFWCEIQVYGYGHLQANVTLFYHDGLKMINPILSDQGVFNIWL